MSECNILEKPNASSISENKWIATVEVFSVRYEGCHKVTCEVADCSEGICVALCCGIIGSHEVNR